MFFWIVVIILVLLAAAQVGYSLYHFWLSKRLSKITFTGRKIVASNKRPFKILVVADSIGAGVGASRFESSLAGKVVEKLAQNYSVEMDNQSRSGALMEDLLKLLLPSESHFLVLIVAGSNNYFQLKGVEALQEATEKVLEKYSRVADKIILEGPGRLFDCPAVPLPARRFYKMLGKGYVNAMRKAASKFKNVTFISPVEKEFNKEIYGADTLAQDKFHPNDSGYQYWFDLIDQEIP